MEKSFHDPCAVQATATWATRITSSGDIEIARRPDLVAATPRTDPRGLWEWLPPVTQPCVEDKSSPILGVASDTQVRV
jgi:hypothetical protein